MNQFEKNECSFIKLEGVSHKHIVFLIVLLSMFLVEQWSNSPDTKWITKILQEVWSVKKVYILDESHLGIHVVNEVKSMADNDAQDTAFEVMATKYPFY